MFSSLSLDWTQFIFAAVVLLVPLPLFFSKAVQFRELDRSWHRVVWRAVTLPWHWVDLVRTGVAVYCLCSAAGLGQSFDPGAPPHRGVVVLVGAILAVAVIVQTVACRAEGGFHVPFAFVFATAVVLFPPALAALALISAVAAAVAARSLSAFLWVLPAALAILGAGLYPNWRLLGIGAAVSLLGAVLPLLFHRESVFAHRALPPDPEAASKLR